MILLFFVLYINLFEFLYALLVERGWCCDIMNFFFFLKNACVYYTSINRY